MQQIHAEMFAQLTHAETAVTAGGGLSSSYSAVADVAVTAVPYSAETDAETDVAATTTTAAVLSSGSYSYPAFAAAETVTAVSSANLPDR